MAGPIFPCQRLMLANTAQHATSKHVHTCIRHERNQEFVVVLFWSRLYVPSLKFASNSKRKRQERCLL